MTPPWKKFEQWVADDLGLQLTRGSGNQWYDKGDAAGRGLLVEVKFSDSKMPYGKRSMRLERAWLDKVGAEAGGRIPFVVLGLGNRYSVYVLAAAGTVVALTDQGPPVSAMPPGRTFQFHEGMLRGKLWIQTPVGIVADYAWFRNLIGDC